MRIQSFVAVALVSFAMGLTGSAQMAGTTATPPAEFVKTLSAGGTTEVELAKLASQKTSNVEVRTFASRMVADHGKANGELGALAAKKSWTAAADPAGQKAAIDKLSGLSGAAFDRAYMDMMVENHQKTEALVSQQAKGGTDPELKAWAAKTLPTIQSHLKQARDVRAKLGN